jgi:hypothetical protein
VTEQRTLYDDEVCPNCGHLGVAHMTVNTNGCVGRLKIEGGDTERCGCQVKRRFPYKLENK